MDTAGFSFKGGILSGGEITAGGGPQLKAMSKRRLIIQIPVKRFNIVPFDQNWFVVSITSVQASR
jgi:hypothetical protein